MTTHQSTVPAQIADYFGINRVAPDLHPVVSKVFTVERGWVRLGYRKRISLSWVRKAKADGVTAIEVAYKNRRADFTVEEIVKRASRDARTPLLGGNVLEVR